MSEQKHTPEPFGYFKAEPFGWTDCAETDECSIPLYDIETIESISKSRDSFRDAAAYNKRRAEDAERQRDELLAGLKAARFHLDGEAHCDATRIIESIENYSHGALCNDIESEGGSKKTYGRDGLMIIAAVRYCIGRMSYIVSDCADWIIANWNGWPENVRNIVRRDIDEAFKRDDEAREFTSQYFPLGMDCDREQWERVRSIWL